jgi:hypothetical protein
MAKKQQYLNCRIFISIKEEMEINRKRDFARLSERLEHNEKEIFKRPMRRPRKDTKVVLFKPKIKSTPPTKKVRGPYTNWFALSLSLPIYDVMK